MNGMVDFVIDKNEVTSRKLPEILKLYDYFTAAFLSSQEFYLARKLRTSGTPLETKNIFSEYFDVFEPTEKPRQIPVKALQWIEQNKNRKFFLWVPIGTVHWPYAWRVHKPFRTMFDPKEYSPFYLNYETYPKLSKDGLPLSILSRIYKENYYVNFVPVYHLTDEDKAFIIARYDAGIYYTDLFIGRLLSVLEKNNLMDKTIIIIHSVHGEDLGEHGYFQHYDIYDTEVKNALIIKFPDNRFGGKRIVTQVQSIDIVPTLLDCLGIPLHHEFQGQSLMPLMREIKSREADRIAYITRIPLWEFMLGRWLMEFQNESKSDAFSETEQKKGYYELLKQHCGVYPEYHYPPYDIGLRTNKWKLILRKNRSLLEEVSWWGFISNQKIEQEEIELYDLEADPFEQNNVARLHPSVVADLKENVLRWDSDVERRRTKKIPADSERSIIPYP
jgi:arylsulfatase A-like enzyme